MNKQKIRYVICHISDGSYLDKYGDFRGILFAKKFFTENSARKAIKDLEPGYYKTETVYIND